MQLQAVFFDFDGVIVDSAPIKTAAFAEMFRKHGPDIEEKVVRYHLAHQGISRFEKFRYAYENILNVSIDQNKLTKLGIEFSKLVLDKVRAGPYIPGVINNLNDLKSSNIPAYIVSGTPDEEIKYIVHYKKLDHYFMGISGSPPAKADILRKIISQNKYEASQCLFLGDAMTDYEAAKDTSVNFIAIANDRQSSPFPEEVEIYSSIPPILRHQNITE